MVALVGLKHPEREDDRRSRLVIALVEAVLVRSTRAGASHRLTDHLPARRGILDRVRLERASAHRDPRLHGRATSALRPAPERRTLTSGRRAIAVRGHSMAERCASRAKRRPRKPVPRLVGWHTGDVGLAQADQVVVMVRSERFPAYWVAFERVGDGGADRLVHTSGS
jgi:hypothetical protein